MGVYIPNWKMPQNCDQCPFIFYDADVNEREWCEAVKPYGIDVTDCQGKRHSNCPLVELPPHGRLIDADALLQYCDAVYGVGNNISIGAIINAPTIIEAEPDCTTCPVKGKACKVFYRDKGDNSVCRELREAESEDADI